MSILVLADHDNAIFKENNLKTIAAAKQIGSTIDVFVVGHNCDEIAKKASKVEYVNKVILCDDPIYENFLAEPISEFLYKRVQEGGYDYLISPSSTTGKSILPRTAALLDVCQISDVSKVISEDTFIRPIYTGNALATVKVNDKIKVMTIRTASFPSVKEEGNAAEIIKLPSENISQLSIFVEAKSASSERPELTSAKKIISGGRGMQSGENFEMITKIADKIGAAVGASRAAVDAGYISNAYQVGQSGKAVAPDLYIAVGISGAIQHLAGMKDSKIIVAINKDEEAPIFQIADYGLVADLFEALPELEKKLG